LNRTEKETFVNSFKEGIDSAQAFAVMSFEKLTVEQMTSFRLSLSKANVKVKVVKNTLAKRAFADSPFKDVASHFTGPTLVAYSAKDPVMTAKAIVEWTKKENFNLKIKAGAALGQVMSVDQMMALSKLPGRNEMLVSFLWALKAAPTSFLYALKDAPQKMGYALGALKDLKAKQGQ